MLRQMIGMGYFFRASDGLIYEIQQAEQEGKDVQGLRKEMESILQMDEAGVQKMKAAENFFDIISALPTRKDFPYEEPSDLEGICKARPTAQPLPNPDVLLTRFTAHGWGDVPGACWAFLWSFGAEPALPALLKTPETILCNLTCLPIFLRRCGKNIRSLIMGLWFTVVMLWAGLTMSRGCLQMTIPTIQS
jgi:hypothetical protein